MEQPSARPAAPSSNSSAAPASTPDPAQTQRVFPTPSKSSKRSPTPEEQLAKREAADGFITAIVTTQVSVLSEDGALLKRIPRDRIKVGNGIPYRYYKSEAKHLIVADLGLGAGDMLLDSSEFTIDPKKPLIEKKCDPIPTGKSPSHDSAASMGHGKRCP